MSWVQVGTDISGTYNQESIIPIALSSNGTILARGEFHNGIVRIYSRTGSTWNTIGEITSQNSGDWNGSSIALSADGTTIAIGANSNDTNGQDSGMVRVFDYSSNVWTQRGASIYGQLNSFEHFGVVSLSANGNIVAVGAPSNSSSAGAVRVYSWTGSVWAQLGADISGVHGSYSGEVISLSGSGTVLAVGGYFYENQRGYVRVFEYVNSNWVQKGTTFIGANDVDHLGRSIKLSNDGNTIAIGIPQIETIRIYDWNQTSWVQRGADIVSNTNHDQTGVELSLSSNGNVVALLAPAYNNDIGQARVFEWLTNSWVQIGQSIDGEGLGGRAYSLALSSDGTILAISTTGIDDATTYARVYTYSAPVPCLPAGTRVLTATGYKAVEKLCQDDLIVTSEGQAVSFKLYSTGVDKAAEVNAPYLIPARTFGKYPVKDLVLSPNHAFQSRPGVWQIPKYAAMMNSAIKQVDVGKPVTYYHIETPDYFKDNLVVEGTVVESFAHKQLRKGEIVYSYSPRYNGFIRSQAARQSQARLKNIGI